VKLVGENELGIFALRKVSNFSALSWREQIMF